MSRTFALILSLVLAFALGVLTWLAMEAAIGGWGLQQHDYQPVAAKSQSHSMEDFGR